MLDGYWHYITLYILCIQNRLLRFGLLSYNRHMSCVTKSFIEKMWEFGDIDRAEALKAGVRLVAATILARFVAGVFHGRARIFRLLFLPTQAL